MTRIEAIEVLKDVIAYESDFAEAKQMAIEALEQESNKDCISRAKAIKEIKALPNTDNGYSDTYDKAYIISVLKELPSIAPKEKIGKWVKVSGYVTPGGDPVWECSECGKGRHVYGIEASSYQRDVSNQQWVACPNCGARMSK